MLLKTVHKVLTFSLFVQKLEFRSKIFVKMLLKTVHKVLTFSLLVQLGTQNIIQRASLSVVDTLGNACVQ